MDKLIEINNNIGKNIEYSIEFFKYTDYELTIDRPTMLEGSYWYLFLSKTKTLTIPLLKISSCSKTQKIWFRNSSVFDKIVVELDNSLDNNIIEFIAKNTKYKTITLNDMKTLGCIIWLDYIDNNGYQQKDRLYVGRPIINTYTNDKLSLTINQLNKMLKGSDFEKNVIKDPTGSFYNYISLKQAFSNIYNIPHNKIDNKSFPMTPFKLDESNYVPVDEQGIVLTDGNIPGKVIYAEDTVGNTDKYIHCQFYYDAGEPYCGYKMTEYDENGDIISEEDESVLNWNVWGNTLEAYQGQTNTYIRDCVNNYQRFFRPFKVVIAGDEDLNMWESNNYRIRRDFKWGLGDNSNVNEFRDDLYEPQVETRYWKQEEIKSGEHLVKNGDRLVYFEVLGDVSPYSAGTTVLYDNHSNVYVYNMGQPNDNSRGIVYWNHIASLVESVPLPKQWLDMRTYITTDKIKYASGLDYTEHQYYDFLSYIKPMCSIDGSKLYTASTRSYKDNQDVGGIGGNFVGNKGFASLGLRDLNLNNDTDKKTAGVLLDYVTNKIKPKSIKFSSDCSTITFIRNIKSGFDNWGDSWDASTIAYGNTLKQNEFPTIKYFDSKKIYTEDALDYDFKFNEKEYDYRKVYNFNSSILDPRQIISEVTDKCYDNAMILTHLPTISASIVTNIMSRNIFLDNVSSFVESSYIDFVESKGAVNYYTNNYNFYWCLNNVIYKNKEVFKTYDTDWVILDYNYDIDRAIIQTPTKLYYYDTLDDMIIEEKSIFGFEYLLSMDRSRLLFTNPIINKSDELIRISSLTNESVRLLSYDGNRYAAGESLASSFLKNSYYDGNGVLNIGFTGDKYELNDYSIISNSLKKYKYDSIEITPSEIEKAGFVQTVNEDATSLEEDEENYDEAISINMSANKDVQLDVIVTRISASSIFWQVINEFTDYVEGYITVTKFNFFKIPLTGIFDGIIITCDFFNTDLAQGEKFRGTIERRKYIDAIGLLDIVDDNELFPFMDDNILDFKFTFFYASYMEQFSTKMKSYFVDGLSIREFNEFEIEVPALLFFDTSYKPFTVGNIITLSSESKYVNGYSLDNGVITPYNENKCDYFIESMVYNMSKGTTKLNLISV